MARGLAEVPYRGTENKLSDGLAAVDYDGYQAIRYRPERALWFDDALPFRVQFFHRGYHQTQRVQVFEVTDGRAREILYDASMFDFRKAGIDIQSLPADLGFAGFRLHFHTYWDADVASFLGASYFRAVGQDTRQYGLSARGLAIDAGSPRGEEFPIFTAFWLERPVHNSNRVTVYALLDSPSIAGAYRINISPGATLVMDVDAALYPRKAIERLGIAPLTSMFLCGENDRRIGDDWRPEIHDSDGLSLHNGNGEWIWRPLRNSADIRVNSFLDEHPQGFGLLQRDRDFDHYQDDGAFYHLRPSAWIEPTTRHPGGWGKGAVQLMEMPAADETIDNVVAYWTPSDIPQPGQELLFSYRLHWGTTMPSQPLLARVVATRTGRGGVVGRPRTTFSWRFAVDFSGGQLGALEPRADVEAVITASRGTLGIISARPQKAIQGYRAMFDLQAIDDRPEPIDLRMYLSLDGEPLTETWIYQWMPPPPSERQ